MQFSEDLVRTLQTRLSDLRFYTGLIDGKPGLLTQTAVIDFKVHHKLRARAYPGPITLKTMFSDSASRKPNNPVLSTEPAWMTEAVRLKGIREKAGPGSNPEILEWAEDLDLHYPDDDIPWCGLFVAHCMRVGAPNDERPQNILGARNWQRFGVQCEPVLGSILVFWRGSRSGWQGHVGFYAGEDDKAYHVLGGNQSNAVTVARISKSRLLSARWPASVPVSGKPVRQSANGSLSQNEA
ncbi:TIGR02594 family protein [Roseibium alexandrii]|uniref:NlpC/P60 family protein n=1 Tax=Roseibium alexandrii TaxID=388408 RepID=UPI0037528CDE